MKNIKIGFLPLYVELYDNTCPEMRPKIEAFNAAVIEKISKYVDVVQAPICRLEHEFEQAVSLFEEEDVDAIVTMHLAYSPSLESSRVLAATKLPIIVLDTTAEYDFGPLQSSDEIMYNHGIHGVQDMCNLLLRNGKQFFVEAGHWDKSDVIERVVSCVRSAVIAKTLRNAQVGVVGGEFKGMGDFAVPFDDLERELGIQTVQYDFEWGCQELEKITEDEMDAYMQECKDAYNLVDVSRELFHRSAGINLVLRNWIECNQLDATTVNFLATEDQPGLPVMPFLEISRSMGRGIGYAGEGDVLTAALTAALLSVYEETTFTEMFCPDWKGNSILLSHMGEININLTAEKALVVEKDFPFTSAENPVVAYGCLKSGAAVLVDIAPMGNGKYSLILSEVDMLGVTGENNMANSVHGWFRPRSCDISQFLSKYSMAGGTHHLVLVYGDVLAEIERFGMLINFNVVKI